MESSINVDLVSTNLHKKIKPNMNVAIIFVLHKSKTGELPVPALSVGIVHQMAGNKFQLFSSHLTLKMTYKHGLATFLLINQSAAEDMKQPD